MKHKTNLLLLVVLFIFAYSQVKAQGMAVNADGSSADGSAMLDVKSTSQGILVPRMTIAQRNAIATPSTGLLIYQTDNTAGFYFFNGSVWVSLSSGGSSLPSGTNGQVLTLVGGVPTWRTPLLSVGMQYGGGIVAYILQPGDPGYSSTIQHGLIAAPSNQSTSIQWGCYATISGAIGAVLGTGYSNTVTIVSSCGVGTAAYICDTLTLGGFTDWHLPSTDELAKIYPNRLAIGGFGSLPGIFYWSSSEVLGGPAAGNAWVLNILDGEAAWLPKYNTLQVRAVRHF